MSRDQRYVSKELTHFVGSRLRSNEGKPNEDEQYELLKKIVKDGRLKRTIGDIPEDLGPVIAFQKEGKISSNDMFTPYMVCFCDIPLVDLHLHMDKYSCFGLAFLKSFLTQEGASPVFYVAKQSAPSHLRSNRGWAFDKATVPAFHKLHSLFRRLSELPNGDDSLRTALQSLPQPQDFQTYTATETVKSSYELMHFLLVEFLCNLKFFDHNLVLPAGLFAGELAAMMADE